MTRYERINHLGDEFLKLVKSGLVSVTLLDWKVYYEAFLQQTELQRKNFSKPTTEEAVSIVAEHYDISKRTLYRVISFMEGV